MHDTLGMQRWRKQCLKQNVIDSGMCEKKRSRTLTFTRPNIAPRSPRTMLKRVNRSGVYKNERLFRTAQSLPQRAFNIGLWGSGGGTDDGTACDASVYFAHTGLKNCRKGGVLHPNEPQ